MKKALRGDATLRTGCNSIIINNVLI